MRGRTQSARRPIDERTFHRWLKDALPSGSTGALPMGDDAAALRPLPGQVAVLSTDALVEGTHFLSRSPAEAIGRAAAAVSLSDAAAKGATPAGLLLDILVPRGTPERWLRSVVLGAERLSAPFGAHVLGGDTKPSPVRTIVSTVIAWGDPHHLAPRSGARPGDLLVVTGRVGRGGLSWQRFRARGGTAGLRALLEITPRVREGRYLARYAHAMLDTSDGLADAARLLSEASEVRVLLEERRIPWVRGLVGTQGTNAGSRIAAAFYGGDYELLAAIPPGAAVPVGRTPGSGATVVGRVARGHGAFLVTADGPRPLPPAGWQPFAATPVGRPRRAIRYEAFSVLDGNVK